MEIDVRFESGDVWVKWWKRIGITKLEQAAEKLEDLTLKARKLVEQTHHDLATVESSDPSDPSSDGSASRSDSQTRRRRRRHQGGRPSTRRRLR